MARDALRHLLEDSLGAPGRALLAWRTRGQAEALLRARGLDVASTALSARLGHVVQRGPFAGMRYPRRRGDIVQPAKLLGSYEYELHEAVEHAIDRAPRLVVNIGSGDGYYVVGMARRLRDATVFAVDPDPLAQHACAATAILNDVLTRISQRVRVDAAGLEGILRGSSARRLAIVDCEGYEDELLDPVRAPALARTDLLVETHDFARAGVTSRLTDRFSKTHDVRTIAVAPRDVAAYPELHGVPAEVASGLLDEFRHHPQSWLACFARD